MALPILAVLAAGCGGSGGPGIAGSGASSASGTSSSTNPSATVMARFVADARCMRSHGVSDFPDPTASPGGGVAISLRGGPGSDLNRYNPTFRGADQACRSLLPGQGQTPAPSAKQIAAEVAWARCLRAHGLPEFPDPDRQGAFDSGKFDPSSPAFQTASEACKSAQPTGPVAVVAGRR